MHILFHLVLYEEVHPGSDDAPASGRRQGREVEPVARILIFRGSEAGEEFFDFQTFDCDRHR
jgi:hypothetical protein